MKRILIFSVAYEPLVGGAELAVRNITDRLFEYEFDLITCRFSKEQKVRERVGNVNIYRVGFGGRLGRYLYPVLAFRLAKILHRQNPYLIVWAIMAAYAGAAALMFLRRYPQIKFLLTLQEGDAISHIHRQVRGFRKQWQRIFKRADYIQTISKFLADWARYEGATCPVEVVPNGVNPSAFSPLVRGRPARFDSRSVSGGLRGGGNSKVIITTSRLVPKNGIDILIKAMSVILEGDPPLGGEPDRILEDSIGPSGLQNDIKLLILGIGPEEQKLKRLARDLKVDGCVEFLGDVAPDKIPEHLAQADIFVRASRSEGLGSAFLEAMAAGLPVIGTRVGGIPEIVTDGQNGFLVNTEDPKDLAEKILLLLQDERLRANLGQNGRKLVEEKFSWDLTARKIAEIFRKILSERVY